MSTQSLSWTFSEVSAIDTLRQKVRTWKQKGLRVGLVPTMGYLHEGHLSLVRIACEHADRVIVSIFVNPTQFGPNEDLDRYPRDIEGDREKIIQAGAHLLFLPEAEVIYPPGAQTFVEVKELSKPLCGEDRPIHFQGVATVVSKLFVIAQPDVAVFGEKDFQQLTLIRQMVRDLHFPVEIVGGPTVREHDGLAMSSRNAYLGEEQRQAAVCLSQALRKARALFASGQTDAATVARAAREVIEQTPHAHVQYLELRDALTLQEVKGPLQETDRLFLAVKFGQTRLIDNAPVGGLAHL